MKKIFLFIILFIAIHKMMMAQNVGIGTTDPFNKLQVQGNLVVNAPSIATATAPTAAQSKTMINASTVAFPVSDSTGRIFDPGGPVGNYLPNLQAFANISVGSNLGIEVTAETMNLATGDSLIIKESSTGTTLLAVGNGYNSTGKWVFNSGELYLIFKSNADANTGAGFSLLFRRLFDNSSSLPDISGFAGNTFSFNAKTGAVRFGRFNNSTQGYYSTAMGNNVSASGLHSFASGSFATANGNYSFARGLSVGAHGQNSIAMGNNISATGSNSIAMGFNVSTSGSNSIAMGDNTSATGENSIAMGRSSTSGGETSTAIGWVTTASGNYSTAIGNHVSTNNQNGSFIIGDNSTTTVLNSANINNFRARFAGGYKLFTSADLSTGCTLFAGDNAWTTGSSVYTKENFAAVNGEDFLQKISRFNLTSWNYKTQDPKTFRHYGPMAQDFYAAFGKDEYGTIGNDTTINSADFAGVSFIAIQALEKRTAEQQQYIQKLEKENSKQTEKLEAVQALLQQLQKGLEKVKAIQNKNL
ncbi:MAG: tail fiber domain-containing protein [Ferruginibacter sp.]|nr:tail fiber domain-containing protein [Ferruginibacter sp.]